MIKETFRSLRNGVDSSSSAMIRVRQYFFAVERTRKDGVGVLFVCHFILMYL